METPEYERLAAVEDRLWYCRALRERTVDALARARLREGARVLEAGCGTGGLLRRLRQWRPDLAIMGLDLSSIACERARAGGFDVCEGSVAALPFADGAFDAVVSLDVLTQVDATVPVLGEFFRCLRPGGTLAVNGAALPWLWSYHDERVQSVRRLRRVELVAQMREAGFVLGRATYWNSFLLPAMILRRKVLPRRDGRSDVALPWAPVNAALGGIAWGERMLTRTGLRLPIGGSLFAVGRRPDGAQ